MFYNMSQNLLSVLSIYIFTYPFEGINALQKCNVTQ